MFQFNYKETAKFKNIIHNLPLRKKLNSRNEF